MTTAEAEKKLQGTLAKDKNEILFSQFGINYNSEPEIFKKGSVIWRQPHKLPPSAMQSSNDNGDATSVLSKRQKAKANVVIDYVDIIQDKFWKERPWILDS
jgi:tRNA(His) guanylyltransferase